MGEGGSKFFGCLGTMFMMAGMGALMSMCSGDEKSAEPDEPPIIPVRFQGAYNSVGCPSYRYPDGEVIVAWDHIKYPVGQFDVSEVNGQSDSQITLKGAPWTSAGREAEKTYVVTYAEVGARATIDGDEVIRCNQW